MDPVQNDVLTRYGLQTQTSAKSNELGQEQFLELMTAQIKHQNPFEPMTNGEFISQMASFGQVSALGDMSESLSNLVSSMTGDRMLRAATLVGHEVLLPGAGVALPEEGAAKLAVIAESTGQPVTVRVFDGANQLVARFDLKNVQAGVNMVDWNGDGEAGDRLPTGTYRIEAESIVDGIASQLSTAVPELVRSIATGGADQSLLLKLASGGAAGLAEVIEIL